MSTKLEQLQKLLAETQAKILAVETGEQAAKEFAEKSATIMAAIAEYAQKALADSGLVIPEGKMFSLTPSKDETGVWLISPALVDSATKRKPAEGKVAGETTAAVGGKQSITIPTGIPELVTLAGQTTTWRNVADTLGLVTGAGSGHAIVASKASAVHALIPHENCPYTK
jgi:hypothetical protein